MLAVIAVLSGLLLVALAVLVVLLLMCCRTASAAPAAVRNNQSTLTEWDPFEDYQELFRQPDQERPGHVHGCVRMHDIAEQ
jgi:hypothetical protein